MPRHGNSLETYFTRQPGLFTLEVIMNIGIALIKEVRLLHNAGFTHNDICLANILGGFRHQLTQFSSLHLADYGSAAEYRIGGAHIFQTTVDSYAGDIRFSSVNQLKNLTTSRRDDLISIFYLLLYLINDGTIPSFPELPDDQKGSNSDTAESLKVIHLLAIEAKEKHSVTNLCVDRASCLDIFAEEVFSLKFEQDPDYDKLLCFLSEIKNRVDDDFDSDMSSVKSE